jgi:hypothetical protein
VREFGVGAGWEAEGGIAIAEGGFQCGAEVNGIEEAANVGFGEVGGGHGFGDTGSEFRILVERIDPDSRAE